MHSRLLHFLETFEIINDDQFGLKKKQQQQQQQQQQKNKQTNKRSTNMA